MATHDLVCLISMKFNFSITYFMYIWKYRIKTYISIFDTVFIVYSEYIDGYIHKLRRVTAPAKSKKDVKVNDK